MGCGKSKHDVVTGNTKTVKKPTEAESVRGKEYETIKRQESCRCGKTNDIAAVVSDERLETTVDNNTKKPEEKEAKGDCNEKVAEETNDVKQPEETETTVASPQVTAVVPAEIETAGTVASPPLTAVVPEETETTVASPPVTIVIPENVVPEETVDDVIENVLPVDEQKETIDTETVVDEEKTVESSKDDGDGNTEIELPEAEEPQEDVQTPVTTELEVEENIPTENVEIAATENVEIVATQNDETPVLEDEDKVEIVEEKPTEVTKEVESA